MKYLVMESATSYAVLLDEDGRFVKSANLGYEIGDTITNPVLMLDKPLEKVSGRLKITNRVIATVVAIAAMVMLIVGVNYYQQNVTPYSSIFMAINPEVEIVLNKSGDVINVNGINADGHTLIEDYNLKSKDKSVIANDMVDRAIEMDYLTDGGRVAIAIDTPDQALFEQYGAELRNSLSGRDGILISVTDMENRDQEPEETPEPEMKSEPEIEEVPADDDSGYDESSYDVPAVEEPAEPITPAPANPTTPTQPERPARPSPAPAPAPPANQGEQNKPNPNSGVTPPGANPGNPEKPGKPAEPSKPANPGNSEKPGKPAEPSKPANPGNSEKPGKSRRPIDASDYYDDTDYETDYDDSDYYDDRPGKGKGKGNRNKKSHKNNF